MRVSILYIFFDKIFQLRINSKPYLLSVTSLKPSVLLLVGRLVARSVGWFIGWINWCKIKNTHIPSGNDWKKRLLALLKLLKKGLTFNYINIVLLLEIMIIIMIMHIDILNIHLSNTIFSCAQIRKKIKRTYHGKLCLEEYLLIYSQYFLWPTFHSLLILSPKIYVYWTFYSMIFLYSTALSIYM